MRFVLAWNAPSLRGLEPGLDRAVLVSYGSRMLRGALWWAAGLVIGIAVGAGGGGSDSSDASGGDGGSGGGGGTPGGAIALDDLPAALAAAQCDYYGRCTALTGRQHFVESEDCVEQRASNLREEDLAPLAAAVEAGRAAYDAESAAACVRA